MDSIETEEYERLTKIEHKKKEKEELDKLNGLAENINSLLHVSIDIMDEYNLWFTPANASELVFCGNIWQVEGFLKGYNFAKSSLPF